MSKRKTSRKKPPTERTYNQVVRILNILDLIAALGAVTLKDVTDRFPDVSERTIRRDLDVLENIGRCEVLPFNGEPIRWHRVRVNLHGF